MAGQAKQALPRANRKARTSAAMIGLALSMGASSLLLPRQDDGASAAEPRAVESTVVPLTLRIAALPMAEESASQPAGAVHTGNAGEHVVREGETLWQLAQRYGVSVEAIATANDLPKDSVLRIGASLKIPASARTGDVRSAIRPVSEPVRADAAPAVIAELAAARTAPNSSIGNNATARNWQATDDALKIDRDSSISRLQQKQELLRTSLAELRSEESGNSAVSATQEQPEVASSPESISVGVDMPAASVSEVGSAAVPQRPVATLPTEADRAELEAGNWQDSLHHQVQPGETLGVIAQSYQVPQHVLIAANQLTDPNRLQVSQTLTIPAESAAAFDGRAVVPAAEAAADSEPQTARLPGLHLATVSEESSQTSDTTYQIAAGDTISKIAARYQVPTTTLVATNQLENPDFIRAGQILEIPVETPPLAGSNQADDGATIATLPEISESSNVEQFDPSRIYPVARVATDEFSSLLPSLADVSEPMVPVQEKTVAVVKDTDSEESNRAQQIAVLPETVQPRHSSRFDRGAEPEAETQQSPYVASLMQEIASLRQQYHNAASGATSAVTEQPEVVASAQSTALSNQANTRLPESLDYINPEFRPDRYTEVLQEEVRRLRQEQAVEQGQRQAAAVEQAATPDEADQLVASAPLGSENYRPLAEPITGRLVSPDLPPLPGADAYLPSGTPVFNGYLWPARGVLTSGYGWRWGRMHRGIDIGAPVGTPVFAAASGTVQFSGWNSGGYGNMVEVRHPDGSMTRYAHHSRNLVRSGQQVEQGQQIAEVGSTGYSTGPHLHFEVHLPTQGTVNPMAYLPSR